MREFAPDVIDGLTAAARSVSLEPALLLALASVETHGTPFEADGSPVILCEPAIFHRELPDALKAQALSASIATLKWSRKGYGDQGTSVGRAARFARMVAVDENAAYRSVSVGLGQIMGFNAGHCGYRTAKEFYEACRDLGAQCRALVAVLPALGVLEALKRHDWVKVAKLYNAPDERANGYDRKLADAYAHWEFALAAGQTSAPHDGLGLWSPHGDAVRSLQDHLTTLGFPVKADGWYGPKTAEAVSRFELRKGIPDTKGIATQAVLDAIVNALPVPQGARDIADESSVAPGSRIVQTAQTIRNGALTAGGLGAGGVAKLASDPVGTANGAMDKVDAAKAVATRAGTLVGGTERVGSVTGWVAEHPLPIVGGAFVCLALVTAYLAHVLIGYRVDDVRTGKTS